MIALVLCFAYFILVNAAEEIEETAYLEEYVSGENLTRNTAVRTCSASLAISGNTLLAVEQAVPMQVWRVL